MGTVATPPSYSFSVYAFSSKEIDQIVTLVCEWSGGRLPPIDRRHYTRNVLKYARNRRLLDQQPDGRAVCGTSRFNVCDDLPPEALWRIVGPMMNGQQRIGRSIASNPAWLSLGISPVGYRRAPGTNLQEQIMVLDILAGHGYLILQMAGDVWEITRCGRCHHGAQ